jgi:heterodisulfide reductase subunit A
MPGVIAILCRCCGQIDPAVDLAAVREKIAREDGVVSVEVRESLCLPEDGAAIEKAVRDSGADRIVVAACSPYGKAGEIVSTLSRLANRPQIRLVDIREGCAWIHREDREGATAKACDLLRMALGFFRYGARSADAAVPVHPACLVVGAGSAGLAAAVSVARAGYPVHLVERGAAGGGMLRMISRVYPSDAAADEKLRPYLEEVERNPRISFHPRTRVAAATGFAGDFKIRLASEVGGENVRVGAVILATGAGAWLPRGLYRYGELRNVLTLMELERRGREGKGAAKRTVFIQCVGARCPELPYCAAMCCPSSIKNAVALRKSDPDAEVTILHRDIMMPGHILERYYRNALNAGVRFVRYDAEKPPVVSGGAQVERVEVFDVINGISRTIAADQVVLSTPLVAGSDNARLSEIFRIPLDRYGFFREDYPLHPLETRMGGIFLCGSARWPVSSGEAVTQGEGAAAKALAILGRERISALSMGRMPEGKFGHARVENRFCTGCGNCVAVCPYEACALQRMGPARVSRVNKMRCRACGSCTAVCPNGTVQMPEHNARAVGAMIRRAFAEEDFR